MKVEKEIYYHANSGKKLNVGDVISFNSSTHNKMYDEVYNSEYTLNGLDANEMLCNKKKSGDNNLTDDEFKVILNTVNNYAFITRELALEEIRKEKYPNYPSRLNCLYVTYNWSIILKRNQKECNQILTLELNGDLFASDGNLMKRQNISYNKLLEIANEYWSGVLCDSPEYLFYGDAKVIDIEEIN